MDGFTFTLIGLSYVVAPVELDKGVNVMFAREFQLPLILEPEERAKVTQMRLYTSKDRGKTWKLQEEILPKSRVEYFSLALTEDGLYWFALQSVYKDGKVDPATKDLRPDQKTLVNAQRRIVKTAEGWIFPPAPPDRASDSKRSEKSLRAEEEEFRKLLDFTLKRIERDKGNEDLRDSVENARRLAVTLRARLAELEARRKKELK